MNMKTCWDSARPPQLPRSRPTATCLPLAGNVGAEEVEDDGEPFEDKMLRLTTSLRLQMAEGKKLDAAIETNMKELGYGG